MKTRGITVDPFFGEKKDEEKEEIYFKDLAIKISFY